MERKKCSVKGCSNLQANRGGGKYREVCASHHRKKYGMSTTNAKAKESRLLGLSTTPCSRCGWHESYVDTHRVIYGSNGGKYVKENVIPLCPNCHRIEHQGRFTADQQTPKTD